MAQQSDAGPVVVGDVRGPLDQRALDFLEGVVHTDDAQVVVLKIDNPGVASGDIQPLLDAITASPKPVVAWVGPEGAVAYGETVAILDAVGMAGGAPGASFGFSPLGVVRAGDPSGLAEQKFGDLMDTKHVIEPIDDTPGFLVQPTIGQFIAALDREPLRHREGR